jgi:small-conductance mechanosensitive channel
MQKVNTVIDWMAAMIAELPDFVFPLLTLTLATAAAILLHGIVFRALTKAIGNESSNLWVPLLRKARRPLRLAMILAALALVLPAVELPQDWETFFQRIAAMMMITIVGWTAILLTNHFTERSIRRYSFDTDDNLQARKTVTQMRVLRRAANVILFTLTLGAILLTFESVRKYGISLFASAGAAGLILGLAARPVLANLIAGIQIALTQPIRLEDVVIVEGEWGWIEEIGSTYVVVRIWDLRRMIVPLSFFIEQPFQNWTRDSAQVIGSVFWYVDYTIPVAAVRAKVEETVRASGRWDGQVVNLQVTDTDKDTVTLRGLMSARTSGIAFDLRCEVREKVLAWLQAEYPGALPRLRGELTLTAQTGDTVRGVSAKKTVTPAP